MALNEGQYYSLYSLNPAHQNNPDTTTFVHSWFHITSLSYHLSVLRQTEVTQTLRTALFETNGPEETAELQNLRIVNETYESLAPASSLLV